VTTALLEEETIASKIYLIRGKKVILDKDLANLYQVETRRLNEQLKRNLSRFPLDFAFQLTKEEWASLRSQIATLKQDRGQHRKYLPYVFTEHGVVMASNLLKSDIATQVSIQVVRTFVKLREFLSTNKELKADIEQLERKYDQQFKVVFEAIKHILYPTEKPKKIGFIKEEEAGSNALPS
jgi:hypothetical protein